MATSKKTKKAKKTKTGEPKDQIQLLRGLFSDQFVDLDLFTQGDTTYRLTDLRGTPRHYRIPNDPPLPVALGFLRAHDRWTQAQFQVARAKGKTADALLGKVESAWSDLVGRPADGDRPERPGAFLELLRILQPEITVAEIRDEIGATYMANWMDTLVLRLQLARTGTDLLSQLLEGASQKTEAAPKGKTSAKPTSG